jgi:hypothetical protein
MLERTDPELRIQAGLKEDAMAVTRVVGAIALLTLLTGCGTGSMILWNPRTGLCDEVPKAAAYALGGALFAATQDVDRWRCEGLKDGDTARTEKAQK